VRRPVSVQDALRSSCACRPYSAFSLTLAAETGGSVDRLPKVAHHRRAPPPSLPASADERAITGHIDFLQVRNGAVHVLDYKPDARTNKPIAQLAIYALALTRLVPGLKLFDIKCAWFNEDEYSEFFPRTLFAHKKG
jgi:ATP-dependent exoDNAse (exonuclease V) beta subunit